ncbi:MAG: hypothetical protein M3004_03900 [Bacteroidota bacterium]|nr:hypothetical protein [Bacteroidota bacterium]
MERKIYSEDFEKFLKGQAEQFKMTPSKKVWHGIYNDLHPGTRWPSITISIVFIFSLVIIGHLNTNNEHARDFTQLTLFGKTISSSAHPTAKQKKKINSDKISTARNAENKVANSNVILNSDESAIGNDYNGNLDINTVTSGVKNQNTVKNINTEPASQYSIENTSTPVQNNLQISSLSELSTNKSADDIKNISNKTDNNQPVLENTVSNNNNSLASKNEESNIQNQNITILQKRKKIKGNVTYYLTPSFSYRNFSDDQINSAVTHRPIPGLEAGTSFNYKIFKQLQFIAGLQVNYSGYVIKTNNVHPTVATLLLNSSVPGQFSTYSATSQYGNRTGNEQTKLKNYSLQVSVPIGFQYVFADNDNIKLSAQANFQPSLIISNKAYLLSSNEKNYMTDPYLLRKWNMSTGLGTYISFKSNSFNWQIGPQIRYQILSTYSNNYSLKEHLVDYGIRFGISRISK